MGKRKGQGMLKKGQGMCEWEVGGKGGGGERWKDSGCVGEEGTGKMEKGTEDVGGKKGEF